MATHDSFISPHLLGRLYSKLRTKAPSEAGQWIAVLAVQGACGVPSDVTSARLASVRGILPAAWRANALDPRIPIENSPAQHAGRTQGALNFYHSPLCRSQNGRWRIRTYLALEGRLAGSGTGSDLGASLTESVRSAFAPVSAPDFSRGCSQVRPGITSVLTR